ncbi:MAG: inactive transglutaminase family protein [Gammaproteobacteria bacterium]|nr:inactive transglutaminase family protein [Gammaproteobacteria bacterium]
MQGYKIWLFALALFLIGGGIFLYKWRGLGYPVLPEEETRIWTVEATLEFDAGERAMPVKATLHIPGLTPGFAVLDENFVSRGFGFTTRLVTGGRQVQWAIRRAEGPQTLYYRAVVYKDPAQAENDTVPPFPTRPVLGEPLDTAVQQLVAQVDEQSADPASFTVELLKRLADASSRDQNIALLLAGQTDATSRARAAVTVLAAAQVPARLMRGVILVDRERESRIVPWLEVHDGDRWLYFDPATGAQGLPENFLTWWRGDDPLFTLDGGRRMEVTFSVQRTEADPVLVAERRAQTVQSRVADFSLFSLPIQSQAVYAVLLMIPLGALVVVILRNVVGITTFGTFMPVLVALAFRETQVLAGVILFSLVVALGLLFRFLMENFRLLLVPRLASVLIIVVMLMALISIVFHQLGLDMGLSVGLFPMVILTMTIERMSIVWEERGPSEAIQQGAGSLVVAAICYTVMEVEVLKHIFFVFPELLLWVLAVCLLLGRYSGYRLLELVRFKSLATPPP